MSNHHIILDATSSLLYFFLEDYYIGTRCYVDSPLPVTFEFVLLLEALLSRGISINPNTNGRYFMLTLVKAAVKNGASLSPATRYFK